MNVIKHVHAHLAAVLALGGIHHVQNRISPPKFPYALTTTVAAPINNTLRGETDLQNFIIQIDVFALKYSEAADLAAAIADRMPSYPKGSSVRTDVRDSYEDGIKAYRISQDFSVWSRD